MFLCFECVGWICWSTTQFIDCVTGQDSQSIGHSLKSCTAGIRTFRANHPDDGSTVALVYTPGFDDTCKSDMEILGMINEYWLAHE
jgi:hypothetical protein